MERAQLGEVELEYEVAGSGEPVVFIHGAFIADAFRPLLSEPALLDRYQLIVYRRRGHGGGDSPEGSVSVAQQASDCAHLLGHLGVKRAHVVGHSFGGAVALQLAMDEPPLVGSLALLEPALFVGESGPGYRTALADGAARYGEAGADGVANIVHAFFQARWPGYRDALDAMLPGAASQAVTDAPIWFQQDLPGLLDWEFGEPEARRVSQPTLAVLGGGSPALGPRFEETHRLLMRCVPIVEEFILPDATHFMHLEEPSLGQRLAEALADFFARHAI